MLSVSHYVKKTHFILERCLKPTLIYHWFYCKYRESPPRHLHPIECV